MNVYFFNSYDSFEYEQYLDFLPPDRREKALRYKQLKDRQNCVASYLLLVYSLKTEYNIVSVPEIAVSETGKPFFKGRNDIFFSISHCPLGAVCAISGEEIGIDIQDIRKADEALINKAMSPRERDYIFASADRNRAFARLWSRKESYLKKSGVGIGVRLNELDLTDEKGICTIEKDDFFISVCEADKIYIKDMVENDVIFA